MSASIRVPFEAVKQHMQATRAVSTVECIRAIHQTHGLGGFYKGFQALLMREV